MYGLDADLKAKLDAAYDPALVKEVTDRIGNILGEHIGDGKPEAWLHDGLVSCKLANAIKPGSVTKTKHKHHGLQTASEYHFLPRGWSF